MTEAQYLSPPEWDEQLNADVADYESKTRLLKRLKEETDAIGEALENALCIDAGIKKSIGILLDSLIDCNLALESRVEALRGRLETQGIEIT